MNAQLNTKASVFSKVGTLSWLIMITLAILVLFVDKTSVLAVDPPPASNFRLPFVGGNTNWHDRYKITRGDCTGHIKSGGGTPVDFAQMPVGTPIYASGSGIVTELATDNGYHSGRGNYVIIEESATTMEWHYLHLSKVYVQLNDQVGLGDLIGLSGNSGNSTGPHLHFEAVFNGGPYEQIYNLSTMTWENADHCTTKVNTDEAGRAFGDDIADNPYNWCPTFAAQDYPHVALFDHKECKGNYLALTTDSFGYGLPEVLSSPFGDFDNRTRSIYVPPGKSVFVADNAYNPSEGKHRCITEDKWNLDVDPYVDGESYKMGWQGGTGNNMISLVWAFDTPDCTIKGIPTDQVLIDSYRIGFDQSAGGIGYLFPPDSTTPSLLAEFSVTEQLPFNAQFHVLVNYTGGDDHYDAMQVCIGTSCNETATTEMYWNWNSYEWPNGLYDVKVRYRTVYDGGNWANAEVIYDGELFLSPSRHEFAPCGVGVDGVQLQSGTDCIVLTQSRPYLNDVGWDNRSDLIASVSGEYEAWLYNSPSFEGTPQVVRSGEQLSAGANVSSVDLRPPRIIPPRVPDTPLTAVDYTVALYHLDEGSGLSINDATGNYSGTAGNLISWVDGKFDYAVDFSNLTSGQALKFGTFDYEKLTVEAWVKSNVSTGDSTIAAQLGGGGNTGPNKWMFRLIDNRPTVEVWSSTGSTVFESAVTLEPNVWYFVMATLDSVSNDVKIYVNNEEVGSHPQSVVDFWPAGATTFEIGARESNHYFKGAIDDVRVSSEIRKPVYLSLDAFVSNPVTREVTAVASWEGALAYIQQLRWDDTNNFGVWGENYNLYTSTFEYPSTGNKTITLTVMGSDHLIYAITKDVDLVSFACDSGTNMEGVVLFDYMDCAWASGLDYAQFLEPGLYNLINYYIDNKATSIHFPQDGSLSARLYEGVDGTGQSICRVLDMWNMEQDLWPDQTPMNNTVSSLEIFANDTCTPPPDMSLGVSVLNPHGEIQANVSWSGASEGWQIVNWGDQTDYGIQGTSGSASPTHWYAAPGTYTVTFTVENAAPDWELYTLDEVVTISDYACGESVTQEGVVFYKFSDCAYRDSADYEQFNVQGGSYNLTTLDNTSSSVHIPSGMSVRLFEGANQTGESWCTSLDMWNFAVDYWPNQTVMDKTVSSFVVYNNTTCTP